MKKIEDFMQDLFDARIKEEKCILAARLPYRKKFFDPECTWDNRQFTLEMIESERIVSIAGPASEPMVITEYHASVSPPSAQKQIRRYQLKVMDQDGNFLISRVEMQCPFCKGQGDVQCVTCKGKHWI